MTALSTRFAALANRAARWPKMLAFALGLVSATGFAPLGLWPLTLLALAGWMGLVAHSARAWRALGLGWCFGLGHFLFSLNWIATAFTYQAAMPAWLGWVAVLLLAFYLALFPALAAGGAWMVERRLGARDVAPAPMVSASFLLAFAALWSLSEWLRSWLFTGFAWNPLSVIHLPASAPVIWVGSYGASALVVLFAGALLLLAVRRFRLAAVFALAPGLGVAFAMLAVQQQSALAESKDRPAPTRITLVQPNIGQEDKWEGDKAAANFEKLARLTRPLDDQPRLILWPEAAIPDYLESGYPLYYYDHAPAFARARLAALMNPGDRMLLGALRLEFDAKGEAVGARNAVLSVDATGKLGPHYDKAHLVPYGEYLPLRPILSALGLSRLAPGDIDFWPGPGPRSISLGEFGRVGLQICYEIIFSGQVVDRANRPDFIFNPSNDAWFGAWGPPQHLAQARLRALEEGLPIIRSTPTGISAVIAADGRIPASIPMHRAGRIDTDVPPPHAPTLFARFGNGLAAGFALLLLSLAIAMRVRRR